MIGTGRAGRDMLLRDRLNARLAEMGASPDYRTLAAEVLGISNVPADLARRLVAQALVVEDRREAWTAIGARITAQAPQTPGVYVLRDARGRAIYVGKAVNLRRRLRAHFAGRRWRGLKAGFARAVDAEWQEVGSELEALLLEARLIHELAPEVNVQTGAPDARHARDSFRPRSRRRRRAAIDRDRFGRDRGGQNRWRLPDTADAADRCRSCRARPADHEILQVAASSIVRWAEAGADRLFVAGGAGPERVAARPARCRFGEGFAHPIESAAR